MGQPKHPIYAVALGAKWIELRSAAKPPKRQVSGVVREWERESEELTGYRMVEQTDPELRVFGTHYSQPIFETVKYQEKNNIHTVFYAGGRVLGTLTRNRYRALFGSVSTPKKDGITKLGGPADAFARSGKWRIA